MWHRIQPNRRRVIKFCCLIIGTTLIFWFAASFLVAYSLTGRSRRPFVEEIPDFPKLKVQELRISTTDGETIGSWYIGGQPEFPVVVLVHGNGGHRATRWPQAVLLNQAGYSVFLISCRAHGDSTGKYNDFGFGAQHDVIASVRWLRENEPNRGIVLFGASLGSAAAVFAMREVGPEIQGLILECPYRDLDTAVWNRMQLYLPPVMDRIAYLGINLAGAIALPHLHQISPLNTMHTIPGTVPVLILAGSADLRARPAEARELHEQIETQSELVVIEGADHLGLQKAAPDQYREVVLRFLEMTCSSLRR